MKKQRTFLRCPACGRRGVFHRQAAHGEDGWQCKYCQWSAFDHDEYESDRKGRIALFIMNPEGSKRYGAVWLNDEDTRIVEALK